MTNQEFIEQVAKFVQKYAAQYGIKVHSPIIAQAILESGWGIPNLPPDIITTSDSNVVRSGQARVSI